MKNTFLENRHSLANNVLDCLLLIILWLLAVSLVNPIGNFPLNDDWSYATAVERLIKEGKFRPAGWTTMPLLSPVLWGTLFCFPCGFSFTALRFSTLCLGLIGVLSTYLLFKELRIARYNAFLGALLLAANPLYFALSNTFMTDVPFMALTVLALLFLIRTLKTESNISLVFGSAAVVALVLCRQFGLFLPLAFLIVYLKEKKISLSTILRAGVPIVVGLISLIVFQTWLKSSGYFPALYGIKTHIQKTPLLLMALSGIYQPFIKGFYHNILKALLYMGLFLFPLLILLFFTAFKSLKGKQVTFMVIIFFIFLIVAVPLTLFKGHFMPLGDNILFAGGIGPITLRDVHCLKLPHAPTLPSAFWAVITVISILSGGLLLAYIGLLVIGLRKSNNRVLVFFLLAACMIYFLPLAIGGYFNRYLLPLIPLLYALISISFKTEVLSKRYLFWCLTFFLICLCFGYSIAGTRDYLMWNRIRWQALRTLMNKDRIPPEEIDGGFEFNGMYLYNPHYKRSLRKSWWWVHKDNYLISFGPVTGYNLVKRYEYKKWLPWTQGQVFVLRKKEENIQKE